ncbi:MocR family transcriptional regulator [Ameyamaea chiangmaiensis NBRC 103196]|uniref:PLP-dependent aminotransferase family protein n=1 Tax=Ameyamaea chiangmaiensis TaxID=442969 RepID=A0A850PHU4_9PROT|nr:PLP-dependent aminotransferase family protein [Ameyamaea chiangmaiensis]MBS4074659.1 PLP-dependent aminotransferase family protein [Ameyamaea chiangmaiensis]NVN40771.1 PLP-dependent aminotransferase family protein [Ameyamaea chiangmaiensis]GBQ65022.1 MocR family transcriptional regulator [Ameyamaea chiangmaiensis NBRC 103196]
MDGGSRKPRTSGFVRWLSSTNDVTRVFLAASARPDMINLAGGLPAPQTYPAEELARIARQAVLDHPTETLGYTAIEGLPALRDAIAARFSTPALSLTRENVLVTTSGMQALDLIGKVLVDPGDRIAVQCPTYLGAIDAWRPRAPRYHAMRLETEAFDPAPAFTGSKFAYTVPNFSNPTGRLVPLDIRQRLVTTARHSGTWLVEDDPYGGLLFDGTPLPGLLDLDADGQGGPYDGPVVRMGTVSKEIAPGLRVGWMIAAPEMIQALTLAKQGSDLCTSGLTQHVALGALQTGLIERIQPTLRALYRPRRDALIAALEESLAPWFTWEIPVGGMFVWAVARDSAINTDTLLHHALDAGVCVSPSSVFDVDGQFRRAVRLNFTLNAPDRLREGVLRLARACAALRAA